jgi:hypothetical protein
MAMAEWNLRHTDSVATNQMQQVFHMRRQSKSNVKSIACDAGRFMIEHQLHDQFCHGVIHHVTSWISASAPT